MFLLLGDQISISSQKKTRATNTSLDLSFLGQLTKDVAVRKRKRRRRRRRREKRKGGCRWNEGGKRLKGEIKRQTGAIDISCSSGGFIIVG